MNPTIPMFSLTKFINIDLKHEIKDMNGQLVPSGIAKTIIPNYNNVHVPNNNTFLNLSASEFFTNYDKELIDKIRTHKFSIGCCV
jgi:hypothetical protein